jgi:hypothetical protein
MDVKRKRLVAAAVGGSAVIASVVLNFAYTGADSVSHVAESGDSATGTTYTRPTVPAMTVSATAMSTGVTKTPEAPLSVEATTRAAPTVSASLGTPCADNGVVLPGGCH